VSRIDNTRLFASGKTITMFSLLKTKSPGNLDRATFGNNKKIDPVTTKTRPRIIKNLAGFCTRTRSFLAFFRNCSGQFRLCVGLLDLRTGSFSFLWQMRFSIIGHVETTALEDQTCTSTYQAFHGSATLGTFHKWFISDLLKFFESMFTFQTLVFVCWHSQMRRVRVRRLECLPP
jgi:hypothetical protein